MTQRLFAAVLPPLEAAEHLDEFLAPRRDAARAAGLRWSAPEQVHLTVAFMAAVPERALDALDEGLAAAAARRTAVRVRIAGGGAFPHPDAGRVLWAGLRPQAPGGPADPADPDAAEDGVAELERLAAGARSAAVRAGVEVDGARWRPHLTVARAGRPASLTPWLRLLDGYAGPAWSADTLSLVHSHLGEGPRGRPRHDVVGEWPLGPGSSHSPDGS